MTRAILQQLRVLKKCNIKELINEALSLISIVESLDEKILKAIEQDDKITKISKDLVSRHSIKLVQSRTPGLWWSQMLQPNLSPFEQLCGLYYYTLAFNFNHPERFKDSDKLLHDLPTLQKAAKMGSALASVLVVQYFIRSVKELTIDKEDSENSAKEIMQNLMTLTPLLLKHLTPGSILLGQAYLFASNYFFKKENPIYLLYANYAFKYLLAAEFLVPQSSTQIFNFYGKKTLEEAMKVSHIVFYTEDKPPQSIGALIAQQREKLRQSRVTIDLNPIQKEASELIQSMVNAGLA